LFERDVTNIADHADYFTVAQHDLADRILAGPERASERFIHDDDGFARGVSSSVKSRPARSGIPMPPK
jgi:hypothetical protein